MTAALVYAVVFGVAILAAPVHATHPSILVTPADREAIKAKIDIAPWGRATLASLQKRVDPYVQRCKLDPAFMSSRLMMNWDTHYITPLVEKSRWIGGEGRAPIPTPRFAGARNWVTDCTRPAKLEDWQPFNDQAGKVRLLNNKTGQMEWVDPGITGRQIEVANETIMSYAADAGFLYWLTGDETYARFAADILWPYMEGFAHLQPPKAAQPDPGMMNIIGPTSFEVIHENLVIQVALAYDFIEPYLTAQGKDTRIIQEGLRRWAQRVIDGGGRDGNWNLNQAMMITYAGLALGGNDSYADGRGRQHFIDVVLNADLPRQKGLTRVIKEGFDPQSSLWPEAPGYGFGTTAQIVELAMLLSNDPAGLAVLEDPLLARAAATQAELIYPNGLSIGLGDTTNTRLRADALEGLIAHARESGKEELETRLTACLLREIKSGSYDRGQRASLLALTKYVAELRPVAGAAQASRSFYANGLNVLAVRNLVSDPQYSLAAAMYGTNGGHVHANGLNIELYGAGLILGADPGRGASYWEKEHAEYYSQPPAHNTVIVNGQSSYPAHGREHISMELLTLEPAPGEGPISDNISFATASFRYSKPVLARQQRTLSLVRTGPNSGFYFDVFKSRSEADGEQFHDYLYHNIGQSMQLHDVGGEALPMSSSQTLSSKSGLLKGYDYFSNEMSAEHVAGIHAVFNVDVRGKKHVMSVWMSGQDGRRVFRVDAPPNRAIRSELPPEFSQMPMPTLLVRQHGDAWRQPFVAVYEPYLAADGPRIKSVRAVDLAGDGSVVATVVDGADFTAYLVQSDDPAADHMFEGHHFKGSFAAVIVHNDKVTEIYPEKLR